jgi:hypothetical protein
MEYALAGLQWETCIIYLNDIIVFSRTFEEHVTRLQSVFGHMRDAGLKIAPKKCCVHLKMTFFSVSLCRGLAILEKSLINLL